MSREIANQPFSGTSFKIDCKDGVSLHMDIVQGTDGQKIEFRPNNQITYSRPIHTGVVDEAQNIATDHCSDHCRGICLAKSFIPQD